MKQHERFYLVFCITCSEQGQAGPMVQPFSRDEEGADEAVKWARAHSEAEPWKGEPKHEVMVPFTIYERKLKR